MYSNGPTHMDELKQYDQLEYTFSSYVRIRDVAQKTSQRRWTIGKSGERGSGISVLAARHEDDNDIYIYIYIYIYTQTNIMRIFVIDSFKVLVLEIHTFSFPFLTKMFFSILTFSLSCSSKRIICIFIRIIHAFFDLGRLLNRVIPLSGSFLRNENVTWQLLSFLQITSDGLC